MSDPPVSGYTAGECVLSAAEGPGDPICEHWFAYTIAPPATVEDKPFPYALCETTCPVSDGLIFESDNGENFKMACGKRYGTKILWALPTETYAECINSCGKMLVSCSAGGTAQKPC